MKRNLAALIVAVIVSAVPVFAHHAFTAEFDAKWGHGRVAADAFVQEIYKALKPED